VAKFTYLLGAGASANRLPTIIDFIHGLEYVRGLFTAKDGILTSRETINIGTNFEREILLRDLSWLIDETKSHATIDTFAKKLFLTEGINDPNYNKLKHLLQFVLTIWHFKKETLSFIKKEKTEYSFDVDPRYDAFFSNIINKSLQGTGPNTLDGRISIISWNYDYQIEYSLCKFFTPDEVSNILFPLSRVEIPGTTTTSFTKLSLNGTVGEKFDKVLCSDMAKAQNSTHEVQHSLIKKYFEKYNSALSSKITESPISYAWEEKAHAVEMRKKAEELLSHSDYLIIIGYSFPNFNREIDKDILNAMNRDIKVIMQCPEKDFEQTRDRFLARLSSKTNAEIGVVKKYTIPSKDINEFHIHRMF
jgi:hypothetical protein